MANIAIFSLCLYKLQSFITCIEFSRIIQIAFSKVMHKITLLKYARLKKYFTIQDSRSNFWICSSNISDDIVSWACSDILRSSSVLLVKVWDCNSNLCLSCFSRSLASSRSLFNLSTYREFGRWWLILQLLHWYIKQRLCTM